MAVTELFKISKFLMVKVFYLCGIIKVCFVVRASFDNFENYYIINTNIYFFQVLFSNVKSLLINKSICDETHGDTSQ